MAQRCGAEQSPRGIHFRATIALTIAVLVPSIATPGSGEAQEGYSTSEFNVARRDNEQIRPRISGKYVVWQDYRNLGAVPANEPSAASADIFGRDIETNSEFSVTERHTAARPAVSGSRIVYTDSRNATDVCNGAPCGMDIRAYDIQADRAYTIVDREGDQDYPAIDGNLVVWQDKRGGDWDIRGKDIDTDDTFVVSTRSGSDQRRPAISGKVVVWEDYRKGADQPDIWARNLDNDSVGIVTERGDARDPSISGFWVAYRTGDPASDNQRIRLINLATKEERAITDHFRIGSGPRISGNLVVWADMRNEEDFNIWGYDISTDKSFKVGIADKNQTAPDISGLVAVWEDARGDNPRDIRGSHLTVPSTTTPTPSATTTSTTSGGPPPPLGGPCGYQLGFATLRNMIVSAYGDIVGSCLENEWHNADNGDGLQRSSGRGGGSIGMMVWRKADNWTAYTDGYQTWLNGPCGLQLRLNTQSFSWEGRPGASCA